MTKPLHVLIIEDCEDDALLLLRELQNGGYEPIYERVETPEDMRTALEQRNWDIIISDYVLPRFSGIDALSIYKEECLDMPFIIVSGNIGEDVAVDAMRAGAHDYIIKGNLKRLVPAVERELRETEMRRERSETEKAFVEQSRILETSFTHTLTPLVFLDKDFNFIRVNEAYAKACQRQVSEFRGHNHFEFYPNEENEEIFRRVVETKTPYQAIAKPFIFPDHPEWGVTYWDWTLVPVFDSEGEMDFLIYSLKDVTERKKAEEELSHSRELLRNLSMHLQSARENERTHIAREIHDELGQALTALKMDVAWLGKKYRDEEPLAEKTRSMLKLIDMTIKSVKRIAAELRPGLLDDLGLAAAIEWQAGEFEKRTGISCDVNISPKDVIIDRDRSTAVFRIFQEAMTNVARHAKATSVSISLEKDDNRITLCVEDNGKGITKKQINDPRAFGLIGIRERVHFLSGEVDIRGIPNKGTSLVITIPLGAGLDY